MRQGGPFGSADNVVGVLPFTLHQHVGLADGIGLRVDLLAEQVRFHLLAVAKPLGISLHDHIIVGRSGQLLQRLFSQSQHAAGTAGPII